MTFRQDRQPRPLRPPWIDRRLQTLPLRPWRKVHLDFHNTAYVEEVGEGFNSQEFLDTLRVGHVDAIVVFAKDMHGYCYYPTSRGAVHPGLQRDLLGEQVAACRAAGITVYGYYCVTWDNLRAEQHPEWLVFRRDRSTYLPRFDETPGWTALCLSHRDFVQVVLDDSREILERYELDGIWYDMPLPIGGECFCRSCLDAIAASGGDPLDTAAQRAHKQQLLTGFLHAAKALAEEVRPGCQVDQNNQTRLGLGERARYLDNIEIEALPTGGWGYQYFPVDVRYSRNFGRSFYGITGRFQRAWADFGGLAHPRQLQVEIAGIIAQGAHCSIGDQAPPSGRLDPAVYQTIGEAYERVERIEDLLEGAAPVVEAAVVVDGLVLTDPGAAGSGSAAAADGSVTVAESVGGLAELLIDHRIQFDVVEPDVDLDRYRLLVIPDTLAVDCQLGERLCRYVRDGGGLVVSGSAATVDGGSETWLRDLGLKIRGRSPFEPAYLVPAPDLENRLPAFEYALYEGSWEWAVDANHGTEVWAWLGEPAFQRSPTHYTSHAQSPFHHRTDLAAVVRSGRLGATSFGLGTSYYRSGYWAYRRIFGALVDVALPERLVRSDAPRNAEISLTQQVCGGRTRWLVHIVNTSTDRCWGPRPARLEDTIPLHDLGVAVDLPRPIHRAWLAGTGETIPLRPARPDWAASAQSVEIEVPEVDTGAVVVLEEQA